MFVVIQKVNILMIVLIICMGCFTWYLFVHGNKVSMEDQPNQKLIVIDPGHGGVDGGASGNSDILEKDINLKVALKLADLLKQAEIPYRMTRDTDVSIHDNDKSSIRNKKRSDLQNRRELVETSGCSMYLGIHMNKFEQSQYWGAQVFYSNVNQQSKALAQLAKETLLDELQDDNKREIKKAGNDIYLLKFTKMPAILVECGFLSNPEEEKLLISDEYQNKLAKALFNTITAWNQKVGL